MSALYPQLFPTHLLMEHPSLHQSRKAEPASPAPLATSTTSPPPEPHDSPSRTATGQPSSSESFPCGWKECTRSFGDAESLYNHLCNDHIGRKSTNNLCLTCHWKDCGTTCAKRDHITSHLRVHTPLKPHVCEICKKTFKRPQDLKKHEKIHTEEHHAAHKHSKAITVSDPAFAARVRIDSKHSRSQSAATPNRNGAGAGPYPGVLNDYGSSSHLYPSWDDPPPRSAGHKRSHDYDPVDDFLGDVKKRRLAPSYTGEMASTLSSLASLSNLNQALANHILGNGLASQPLSLAALAALNSHSRNSTPTLSTSPASSLSPPNIPGLSGSTLTQSHTRAPPPGQSFNPTSVSLDIRTPEELQAVNAFLLALGRDIASLPRQPLHESHNHHSHSHSHSQTHPAPRVQINDTLSPENWFNSDTFAQFGLSSLPGLAAAHDSHPSYSQSLHGSKHGYSDSSNMYRHFDDLTSLGLGNGHERKLAVSSLTPPAANVSPISTSSSIGSSHATGCAAPLEAPHHMRTTSGSESHSQYIDHIGGIGHQVKTSFGNQVRRPSLSGGQLSAPSLGVREGAGLLGPQGIKSALRLQASPRAAAEREEMEKIKEDGEEDDEDIDELADDTSTTSEGIQEEMVLDIPSRLPTPAPASKTAVSEDLEGLVDASDPELAAHKPGDSLYPLLHIEGDPALKLPALDFKGESKSPALPSITATVPMSSLRSSATTNTKSNETPSVSSLYADLSSATNPPASSLHKIQDRALSPSVSSASSGASMSPRRPSLSSVSSSSPPSSSRNNVMLPSLASVILNTPPRAEEKPLAAAPVSVEEISMEERARHAALVRNLMIYVNLTYLRNQEALKRAADVEEESNGEGMEVDEDGEVRSAYRAGSVESRTSVRSVSVGA